MTYISRSSDFSAFIFCSEKRFSFIGKAQFRRATLSCDSSYYDNYCFQFLVLQAIREDSPTVPALLTDYILKGMYLVVQKSSHSRIS